MTLTTSPTAIPIPVSGSRSSSTKSLSENPVVSTTSAVAATVVASPSNHGTTRAPVQEDDGAERGDVGTDQVAGTHANSTPATAAAT